MIITATISSDQLSANIISTDRNIKYKSYSFESEPTYNIAISGTEKDYINFSKTSGIKAGETITMYSTALIVVWYIVHPGCKIYNANTKTLFHTIRAKTSSTGNGSTISMGTFIMPDYNLLAETDTKI